MARQSAERGAGRRSEGGRALSTALIAGAARVELAPAVGGAIAGFRFHERDILRPTDQETREAGNVRGFACYPLVPWSNRIANARLDLRDRGRFELTRNFGEHPHAIHGVGWQRAWQAVRVDATHALIALDHEGDDAWPFAFHATQAFGLQADRQTAALTCTLSIRSNDARAFPFGLGWHPFFPRDAQTRLGFTAGTVWETEATRLPTREAAPPVRWRFDSPRAIADTTLDNVFAGWDGSATLEWPVDRRQVVIEADRACTHLVIYIPPERDFLAIEPVTHMTDAFNREARGEQRTGTRWLEPGEARSCTMRVVATLA